MKIAIHNREGSFSDGWIAYCKENSIPYCLVDCYSDSIISQLKELQITHLMWHINHASSTDLMAYPNVLNSADIMGIKTFPDFNTRWHFDDKVSQKFLLESIEAPLVESTVFYTKEDALDFLRTQSLPIVSKLKRGAGSNNVYLLKTETEFKDFIDKMFGEGIISSSKSFAHLDQKLRVAKKISNPISLAKKTVAYLKRNRLERKIAQKERGYAYFQEFLPNNDHDTRVIVIGGIAFAIRRMVKKDDFKASGSGLIDYDADKIDPNMIEIAFSISDRLGAQCIAYDFILDGNNKPKIVEMCFGFSAGAYASCPGYWKRDLSFTEASFSPQELMMTNFIED